MEYVLKKQRAFSDEPGDSYYRLEWVDVYGDRHEAGGLLRDIADALKAKEIKINGTDRLVAGTGQPDYIRDFNVHSSPTREELEDLYGQLLSREVIGA